MSSQDQPDWETDTVPTPRVRVEPTPRGPRSLSTDTVEMPAVGAGSPGSRPRRERRQGREGQERPPGGARAGAPARPPRLAPGAAPRRRGRGGRVVVLLGALLLAGAVGVLAGRLLPDGTPPGDPAPAVTGDAAAPVAGSWSSVDPVGGSGFRQVDASTWRTQSYRSAEFGNLKPGVGLLADLGAARELGEVVVDVAPVGVALELRAGDSPSDSPDDYAVVAAADDAAGPTTLDASGGGAHRYWMLWVTRLGPREGGYVAELSQPTVRP